MVAKKKEPLTPKTINNNMEETEITPSQTTTRSSRGRVIVAKRKLSPPLPTPRRSIKSQATKTPSIKKVTPKRRSRLSNEFQEKIQEKAQEKEIKKPVVRLRQKRSLNGNVEKLAESEQKLAEAIQDISNLNGTTENEAIQDISNLNQAKIEAENPSPKRRSTNRFSSSLANKSQGTPNNSNNKNIQKTPNSRRRSGRINQNGSVAKFEEEKLGEASKFEEEIPEASKSSEDISQNGSVENSSEEKLEDINQKVPEISTISSNSMEEKVLPTKQRISTRLLRRSQQIPEIQQKNEDKNDEIQEKNDEIWPQIQKTSEVQEKSTNNEEKEPVQIVTRNRRSQEIPEKSTNFEVQEKSTNFEGPEQKKEEEPIQIVTRNRRSQKLMKNPEPILSPPQKRTTRLSVKRNTVDLTISLDAENLSKNEAPNSSNSSISNEKETSNSSIFNEKETPEASSSNSSISNEKETKNSSNSSISNENETPEASSSNFSNFSISNKNEASNIPTENEVKNKNEESSVQEEKIEQEIKALNVPTEIGREEISSAPAENEGGEIPSAPKEIEFLEEVNNNNNNEEEEKSLAPEINTTLNLDDKFHDKLANSVNFKKSDNFKNPESSLPLTLRIDKTKAVKNGLKQGTVNVVKKVNSKPGRPIIIREKFAAFIQQTSDENETTHANSKVTIISNPNARKMTVKKIARKVTVQEKSKPKEQENNDQEKAEENVEEKVAEKEEQIVEKRKATENCDPSPTMIKKPKLDQKPTALSKPLKPVKFKEIEECVIKCDLTYVTGNDKAGRCQCKNNGNKCGDGCLNRATRYECSKKCGVGDECTNRRFQNHEYSKLESFVTELKGRGVRALEPITKGTFIVEYVGEIIDDDQHSRRAKRYAKDPRHHHFYVMTLTNNTYIDATKKGNVARYINHSCDPNAVTEKWTVDRRTRIGFFATKDIKVGEEIVFDYKFERFGKTAQKCYCGSLNCRGVIGVEAPDGRKQSDAKEIEEQEIVDTQTDDSLDDSSSSESENEAEPPTNNSEDPKLSNKTQNDAKNDAKNEAKISKDLESPKLPKTKIEALKSHSEIRTNGEINGTSKSHGETRRNSEINGKSKARKISEEKSPKSIEASIEPKSSTESKSSEVSEKWQNFGLMKNYRIPKKAQPPKEFKTKEPKVKRFEPIEAPRPVQIPVNTINTVNTQISVNTCPDPPVFQRKRKSRFEPISPSVVASLSPPKLIQIPLSNASCSNTCSSSSTPSNPESNGNGVVNNGMAVVEQGKKKQRAFHAFAGLTPDPTAISTPSIPPSINFALPPPGFYPSMPPNCYAILPQWPMMPGFPGVIDTSEPPPFFEDTSSKDNQFMDFLLPPPPPPEPSSTELPVNST